MWKSKSIEVIIALPDSDMLMEGIRENTSQFHFSILRPEDFENISPEQWANTDILITDTQIPSPDHASNLKWVQFYREFNLDQVNAFKRVSPNTLFTSAEGVDLFAQATDALHLLLSPEAKVNTLYHATVGIIGYDSLGREIARLLKSFHCTILAATFNAMNPISFTYQPKATGDENGELFDRLYPIQALQSMLSHCDFVINTLPLSSKSNAFINAEVFKQTTPGTPVINATHPDIIVLESLKPPIDEGKIIYLSISDLQNEGIKNNSYMNQFLDLLQLNLKHFADKQPLLNQIQ